MSDIQPPQRLAQTFLDGYALSTLVKTFDTLNQAIVLAYTYDDDDVGYLCRQALDNLTKFASYLGVLPAPSEPS